MKESITSTQVSMMIRKPIADVFEAFIDPAITTKFWFTRSSGKLEEGKKLIWGWDMYNVEAPVLVRKIMPNKTIEIEWGEGQDHSIVTWDFDAITEKDTYVTITNAELKGQGDELIQLLIDTTGGFTMVLAGLKAWLEHGIQLHLVGDKFPKELRDTQN